MKNYCKIEVVPYDHNWVEFFRQESDKLQKILGTYLKEIYHIGSTAIPVMSAKSVIDILLVFYNLDAIEDINRILQKENYATIQPNIIPHWSFFSRRADEKIGYHLHIYGYGDPQINRHINFRDYMITHRHDADRYAELKMNLEKQFPTDIYSYVKGKGKLVQEIDVKAKLWEGRKRDYLTPNTGPKAQNEVRIKLGHSPKLVKAMEANLNVQMTHFAQYIDTVELIRAPDYTIVNSRLPDDTFNYVLRSDFTNNKATDKIDEVTQYFHESNTPFSWWVSPSDKPDDLTQCLEKKGYRNVESNIAMWMDLDAWDESLVKPIELQIVLAKDEKTLQDFALVLSDDRESFKEYFKRLAAVLTDEDPIEFFVGYVEGEPVVRGLSCYYAQVVGLYWLSTALNQRKKGYGMAMQAFRLNRAKGRGYHIAVLQASEEGYPLDKKLGFRECGVFKEFKLELNKA